MNLPHALKDSKLVCSVNAGLQAQKEEPQAQVWGTTKGLF
jgi:hypothetical protein